MQLQDYISFLEKTSYMEGILRACEASRDIFPLQAMLTCPEMKELLYKHFQFSSSEEFLDAFTSPGDHFYRKLDEIFAGRKVLFHSRKQRSEHTVPNTQVCYCLRGQCFLYVNGSEIRLKTGDVCIIAPNVPTNYCNLSEDTIVIHVVLAAAFISESLLPRLPREYTFYRFFRAIIFEDTLLSPYLLASGSPDRVEEMSYMLAAAFYHNTYKPTMWEEIVNQFVLLFFSYLLSGSDTFTALETPENISHNTLTQLQDYITHNCRNVTLRQLADVFHFNQSYLSQYLKKNTGENFTDLLQKARITQAEKLLSDTALSVAEIADKVGYQNVSYFYKVFEKINHCSPTEYRNRFLTSNQRVIGRETI